MQKNVTRQKLCAAFGMEHTTLYGGTFLSLVYAPIELFISVGATTVSRRHELEADFFAAKTCNGSLDINLGA